MGNITLEKVQKTFGDVEVIPPLDLEIGDGEFVVFVGPSGCGKSTLLRLIAGLEDVSSGKIMIDGKDATDLGPSQRGLAMVFQSYALYPHMSVRQNLSFGLENINTPRAEIAAKVAEVAKMLQIDMLLDRRPKDLSGGQRQRVAIGRAVVREPKVFLFDEPLSNLDAELRVEMRGEIVALHRRLQNSMIYVTHDQVEAMTMADKIAVLRLGRLEQFGRPLDLYNRPENLFVAGFIGSPRMNFIRGRVSERDRCVMELQTGEQLRLPEAGFAQQPGEAVTLGIRPHQLRAGETGAIRLEVAAIEQLGGDSYLYGKLRDGTAITLHMAGQTSVRIGEAVAITPEVEAVHLFDSATEQSLRRD